MDHPKRVILGITGGIAAYKAPALVRSLRRKGIEVRAVLTGAACPLVGIEALRVLSDAPVYTDGTPSVHDIDHIRLSQWADALLVAPATANTIAKLAGGIADNLLTTLALSIEKPIMLAPAMNTAMWNNAATRRNVATLLERGITVLPVGTGPLACGTEGPGRMLDVEDIAEQTLLVNAPRHLRGRRVLIASGPTMEAVDPVRVLTNRSSGRMGFALAHAAHAMGAEVTVVSGPAAIAPPAMVHRVDVGSAEEMAGALEEEFDRADMCIMAAAVGDFRAAAYTPSKIARESDEEPVVRLKANPDIAARLGMRKDGRFLVGFALESDDEGHERAVGKMRRKGCDMMVYNTVSESLGAGQSRMALLHPEGPAEPFPSMDKRDCAFTILLRAAQRMGLADG